MLRGGFLGRGDGDQLDLRELVLAQHAARVAPRSASLGPEAGRQRGQADRQRGFGQHLGAREIGQRHFGGRDQPAAIGGAEQVLAEFRQLPGAVHGRVIDQEGHRRLGVAVLIGMQRDHPMTKRTFEPRERALQHREARAGELGGGREVHEPQRLAQLEMLLGGEGQRGRGAMDVQHHIGRFVGPVRHIGVQPVRQRRKQRVARGFVQVGGRGGGGVHRRLHLGLQPLRPRRIAGLHGSADLAGQLVAGGLRRLDDARRLDPQVIEAQRLRRRRRGAAPRQRRVEGRGIGPQRPDVMHGL